MRTTSTTVAEPALLRPPSHLVDIYDSIVLYNLIAVDHHAYKRTISDCTYYFPVLRASISGSTFAINSAQGVDDRSRG